MEYRYLGKTGERVSAIGLGTYGIRSEESMLQTLMEAHSLGINLIDTAEMYGWGSAERLVGEFIRRVGREEVFVITKLLPERFSSPDIAVKAAAASLRRLGVKSADLILIHWPAWGTPVEKQVRSLEAIAEEGLTRYIGVSNFDHQDLAVALASTRRHEIVADQVKYSVLDRRVESRLLPYARERGVAIQAYTPLERCGVSVSQRVIEIAEKVSRTPVQVALNYLLSQRWVIPIVKTENKKHLEEIVGSLGWSLKKEDISYLRGEHKGRRPP